VGKAAEQRLRSLGIRTIGDLANTDPATLSRVMKKQGDVLWRYANGLDEAPVETESPDAKGYSNSTTLSMDITEAEDAKKILLSLTDNVCRRLRQDDVRVETVTVQLRFNDLTRASHQCALPAATNITQEIYGRACSLFEEMWDGTPIRLVGVAATKVSRENQGRQMSLFDDTDYEKLEKLDKAMDSIRTRFGSGAVLRASSLNAMEQQSVQENAAKRGQEQ